MGALQNYKLSWLEKTKSINECVFWSIWVGLEICWFSPLEQVTASIWVSSEVVEYFLYQDHV